MLDCETPEGKKFMNHQRSVQSWLESRGYLVVEFPDKDNSVDILIAKKTDGIICLTGIAEIRSRAAAGNQKLTVNYIKKNGYLVSNDKLTNGILHASLLNVPFFIIVKLIHEDKVLIWDIGKTKYTTKSTETKDNCNGGRAVRTNAFLPYENCLIYEFSEKGSVSGI